MGPGDELLTTAQVAEMKDVRITTVGPGDTGWPAKSDRPCQAGRGARNVEDPPRGRRGMAAGEGHGDRARQRPRKERRAPRPYQKPGRSEGEA